MKVIEELTGLNVDEAAVFVGLTIHRHGDQLVPTLTIMGDTDTVTPEQAARIKRAIIESTREVLPW